VILLFHGKDSFRTRQAVREVRERLRAADDMLDSNTTTLDGAGLTPQELLAHATAVPFLAANRLVIVEGLLKSLGSERGGGRRKKGDDDPLEPWRAAAATLGDKSAIPGSTTLIFAEGNLLNDRNQMTNKAFPIFAPVARVTEFDELKSGDLAAWIGERAKENNVTLAARSLPALAQLIGPDLSAIENELQKLAAYADGAVVEPEMVSEIVSAARETKIWDLTDAIVVGDERKALRTMRQLLTEDQPAPVLMFMIVRQFRQLVTVKDMRERGARPDDIQKASGVPSFRLAAVGNIASSFSWPLLRAAYGRLLEADLSVKRGLSGDEAALQLVVQELCSLAPVRGSGRAPAGRR
jgi:DNA polymerase-3 subunit delta